MIRYNTDTTKFEAYENGSWQNVVAGSVATNAFVNGGNAYGSIATLGANDAFPLTIRTNGIERLRVDSSGNIGIGTISPDFKLQLHSLAGSNTIIALSDEDVSHPITGLGYAADVFAAIGGSSSSSGGASLIGFTDAAHISGIMLRSHLGHTAPTAPGVVLRVGKTDGATGITNLADSEVHTEFRKQDNTAVQRNSASN